MKNTASIWKKQWSGEITSITTFPFETMESVTPCSSRILIKVAPRDFLPLVDIHLLRSFNNTVLGTTVKGFCKRRWSPKSVYLIMIGRLSKWAWPYHMSPMKTKNFLWLVSRGEVREMCPTWPKRKQTSNRGHQARYCQQELKAVPGQQIGGKKDLSPTAARKWILSTTSKLRKGLWAQIINTVLDDTSFSAPTQSIQPCYAPFPDLHRNCGNKFVVL